MFPGLDPKMMKQAMKRMGIKQEELDAKEVIIKFEDKELVFTNPQVSKIDMMGQETYQITGEAEERSIDSSPEINEDDIKTVVEQTGCDEKTAKKTLEQTKGDIAEAIIKLK